MGEVRIGVGGDQKHDVKGKTEGGGMEDKIEGFLETTEAAVGVVDWGRAIKGDKQLTGRRLADAGKEVDGAIGDEGNKQSLAV